VREIGTVTLRLRLRLLLYRPQTTKTLDEDDGVRCPLRNIFLLLTPTPTQIQTQTVKVMRM
jgi:hypothetical protein